MSTFGEDFIATWHTFPESVRDDECFATLREEFERNQGNVLFFSSLFRNIHKAQ